MDGIKDINKELLLRIAELECENKELREQLCLPQASRVEEIIGRVTEGVAFFKDNHCLYADRDFRNHFGLGGDQAASLCFDRFIAAIDKAGDLRKAIDEGRKPVINTSVFADTGIRNLVVRILYPYPEDKNSLLIIVCDVTGIIRRAENLKSEHDELETIFDTSVIGIMYLDMNRCVRRVNKRGAEIIGLRTPEDAVGKNIKNLYEHDDDYETFTGYYQDILQHGKVFDAEYQFHKSDGSVLWIRLSGKAIFSSNNQDEYLGTIWIFDDISDKKMVQQELEAAHSELHAYFENSLVGMMVVNTDSAGNRTITRTNDKMVELSGFTSKEDIVGHDVNMFCCPWEKYGGFLSVVVNDLVEFGIAYFERELKKQDGSVIWVSGYAQNLEVPGVSGVVKRTVVIIDDTTEKKADREKLEQANAELETYFNNSMVGIMVSDERHRICRTNARLAEILGYKRPEELVGRKLDEAFNCLDDTKKYRQMFEAHLSENKTYTREMQVVRNDGHVIWLCFNSQPIDKSIPADLSKGVVCIVEDISARKGAEAKLIELATIDELTRLHNRRSFMSLGEKECSRSRREGYKIALFMMDLDYFKQVNDTYGHAVGDNTLRFFAEICSNMFRPSDIIGRIGGEEFAVLLPDISEADAEKTAERFRRDVNNLFAASEEGLPEITVSIGVGFLHEGESLGMGLSHADKALYAAKKQGRNRVVVVA